MALGGKSVGRSSTTQQDGDQWRDVSRRLAVAVGALLAVAMLGACEYADTDPVPRASSSATPSLPLHMGLSEEEAVRQSQLMAEVDSLMGPQPDIHFFGFGGAGRGGTGISSTGLLPDEGNYPVRAACTGGQSAVLTIRQNGAVLLKEKIGCGTPYNAVVHFGAGEVSAALEPTGHGLVGGAVLLAAPMGATAFPGPPPG